MVKFLGVISNSTPKRPADRVFEYTDFDLLTNFLNRETKNLYEDFLKKLQFVNEREMLILENANKFQLIYDFYQALNVKIVDIERDTDEVGFYLREMEKTINALENHPDNIFTYQCPISADRDRMYKGLVKFSKDMNAIENELSKVEKEEDYLPLRDPYCFDHRLIPFLDTHTKILEQIENKISRVADLLQDVNQMFFFASKKLHGDNYHKAKFGYSSDC